MRSDGGASGPGKGRPGLLAVATHICDLLGGVVDPRVAREVGAVTGSDLGAVTEVVLDAKETGCLVREADAWRLTAPLPTQRLIAFVSERVGELPDHLRDDARMIALGSPLTIREARAVLDPRRVRELEALGWVRFTNRGRDQVVVIADPARREVVLTGLTDDTRAQYLRALVEVVGDDVAAGPFRVARWRLEIGGWPAQRFEAAAARAYAASDTVLAEQLAARAVELGSGSYGAAILAVTRTAHGDVEGARAAEQLAEARSPRGRAPGGDRGPGGDRAEDRSRARGPGQLALVRAHHQAIGQGRWGQAAGELERAVAVLTEPRTAAALRAYASLLHALDGDPDAADALRNPGDAAEVSRHAGSSVETRVIGEVAAALAAASRLDRPGIKRAVSAVAELSTGDGEVPLASELVRGTALWAADPRPPQERLGTVAEELDRALGGPDPVLAWWLTVAGRLHLAGGDLVAAHERFTHALMLTEVADPVRLRPRLIADLALVAALQGVPAEAQRLLDALQHERTVSTAIGFRCELVEIVIAARYEGPEVVDRLAIGCGDRAMAGGRVGDAVFAWHLAARYGDARSVVERLSGRRRLPDHPMVSASRQHASAVADQDAPALIAVAKELAAAGRYLVAAESAATAARWTASPSAYALAGGLAAACPDVHSPLLDGVERVVLSPRRAEVARAASLGATGPHIAQTLELSPRTVDNHLARIYRLLGVTNRRELQEIYRPDLRPLAA